MRTRETFHILHALALLALVAPAAHAGPLPAREAPDPAEVAAPASPAPAGDAAVLDAARRSPAAQQAMSQMAWLGYARRSEWDAVAADAGRAFVTLGFSDPADPAHAPFVLVASDASGATPRTWVAGGVFVVDATGHVQLANDVPESADFVVASPPESGLFGATGSGRTLREWATCAIPGCIVSFTGCTKLLGLLGVDPRAQAGCAIAGCGLAGMLCLW